MIIQSLENLIIRNGFDTDKVVSFIKKAFFSLFTCKIKQSDDFFVNKHQACNTCLV